MENKEKAILKAAEEEFMLKGFDGAKTTSIALKAGVTHAMLHYYYRTKQKLFEQVLTEKMRIATDSIFSAFSQRQGDFVERLLTGVDAHFEFLRANKELPRFVINQLISVEDRRAFLVKNLGNIGIKVLSQIQKELDAGIELGKFKPIKAFDLLVDIVSLNLFPFVTLPIIMTVGRDLYADADAYLDARKREIVKVIKMRLLVTEIK